MANYSMGENDQMRVIPCPHYERMDRLTPSAEMILLWEPLVKKGAPKGSSEFEDGQRLVYLALCPTCRDVLVANLATQIIQKMVTKEVKKAIKEVVREIASAVRYR